MNLSFATAYKSVKRLPIAELPNLTILTGHNGAGKTHFLEAISGGHIKIEGINHNRTRIYRWNDLIPSNETGVFPRNNSIGSTTQALNNIINTLQVQLVDLLNEKLDPRPRTYLGTREPGDYTSLTREQVIQSQSNGPLFLSLNQDVQENIKSYILRWSVSLKNSFQRAPGTREGNI